MGSHLEVGSSLPSVTYFQAGRVRNWPLNYLGVDHTKQVTMFVEWFSLLFIRTFQKRGFDWCPSVTGKGSR